VPGIDKQSLAALDAQVGKVMDAYNAQNWKAFYGGGWAEQTKALQTEQTFTALYKNLAMKNFGTLKSKTMVEGESTFSEMVGLIVYKGQFSKKPGKLSVNFFKEGGTYKIQQLRIDP